MSHRTVSKMNRAIYETHRRECVCHACRVASKFGLEKPRRVTGYLPAKERELKWLQYSSRRNNAKVYEIPVLVSDGQRISGLRAWQRDEDKRVLEASE